MEEGKIILTVFPQDAEKKLRPALVLREFPKYGDLLICGITSRLNQFIPEFDIVLDEAHPDFDKSGLKAPAVCRLNMLTMLPKQYISGTLGAVSAATHYTLLKNLSDYLIQK
ncbi:MAG: type II toxin-antitoxin system PemK/MazF family toxin [Bacteroidota bacterium]